MKPVSVMPAKIKEIAASVQTNIESLIITLLKTPILFLPNKSTAQTIKAHKTENSSYAIHQITGRLGKIAGLVLPKYD